ncbi:MAG TPA: glycosyltransferase, partial [Gaiellaceae bacterium]|nr:glycosyltransferase [Gaiellaceae bacterium]
MKVVVLTTSYPSDAHPVAGTFVAAAVESARAAGVDVDVVSPDTFPQFGIAYGGGIAQNLRAAPWKLALVPAFLTAFSLAARRAARDADLVHAHWIPSAIAARATGKPYVLQVWGTDVELARRAPALARPLLRGARTVIAASSYLADEARALGARDVAIVPTPVFIPEHVGEPADPPHVLFAGRLSEEKGILEFLEATEGLPRVIVGDGPLRDRVPEAIGFVPPGEMGAYYEAASVVCVPSRREGYGMTAREAMAYGRP